MDTALVRTILLGDDLKTWAGWKGFLAAALLCLPLASQAKVDTASAYSVNILSGLFTGGIVGGGIGSISYAGGQNQNPTPVITDAVYGAVGTALLMGLPMAAYEVAMDRPGIGANILYDTLTFTTIGALVGSAAGSITYKDKVGGPKASQAEDFLGAAGWGICAGALAGLGTGFYEAFWMNNGGGKKPAGSGIHAKLGIVSVSTVLNNRPLPNIELAQVHF